jgi:hypothetical protein
LAVWWAAAEDRVLTPERVLLFEGDVLEALRLMPDCSADALLCDPPYGLGNHAPTLEEILAYLAGEDLDSGGDFMGKQWSVPSVTIWKEALRVLKPGAPVLAFGGTRMYDLMALGMRVAGFELRDTLLFLYAKGFPKSLNLEGEWGGYGTALKPSFEPICLARKPLDGTVAENVARWGVGGLAIDACSIGTEGFVKANPAKGHSVNAYGNGLNGGGSAPAQGRGRWPANLLLDEDAAAILDAEVAVRRNGGGGQIFSGIGDQPYKPKPSLPDLGYMDGKTNPSRFFFTSKVSTAEREFGCEGLPLRSAGEVTDREDGSEGLDNPRAGAWRTGGARNVHPTLKPIALARDARAAAAARGLPEAHPHPVRGRRLRGDRRRARRLGRDRRDRASGRLRRDRARATAALVACARTHGRG